MSKTVYVIDDEKDILEAISIILKDGGYTVITDTQFITAKKILDHKPDIILLDLLLIGANGKEICTQIRSQRQGKHVPIILVSAHPETKLQEYSKECQATGYLQKPFDIDVLLYTVRKHVL